MNHHLDSVQGELEALKEFLRGSDDYQMDTNTLINVSIWIRISENQIQPQLIDNKLYRIYYLKIR